MREQDNCLNLRNAYVALESKLSKIVAKGHFDQQFLDMFAISNKKNEHKKKNNKLGNSTDKETNNIGL